jgi:hypothetical protein
VGQQRGQVGADLFFLAPRIDELIQGVGTRAVRNDVLQRLHAGAAFLRAGFEQLEEPVIPAEKLLERKHIVL